MTNDFDLKAVRKQLTALRTRYGANSPVGHRCSNLIEKLKNYPILPMENKVIMRIDIAKSVAGLAKLTSETYR